MKINAKNLGAKLTLAVALASTGTASIITPALAANTMDTTTAPAKPNPAQALLDGLADKLGRDLTKAEAGEIKKALDTAKDKVEEANATFVEDVADIFDLSIDQVKTILKQQAPLAETLGKLLGRKLTKAEVKALQDATKARQNALKAAQDELIMTIASITGITPGEVCDVLKPPAPPKPEDKPGTKPTCNPETKPAGKPEGQPAEKPECKPGQKQLA